jgi:hypothetical protein
MDSETGGLYCSECEDFVYSDTFDALYRSTKLRMEEEADSSREVNSIGRGRERGAHKTWAPPPPAQSLDIARSSCRGELTIYSDTIADSQVYAHSSISHKRASCPPFYKP